MSRRLYRMPRAVEGVGWRQCAQEFNDQEGRRSWNARFFLAMASSARDCIFLLVNPLVYPLRMYPMLIPCSFPRRMGAIVKV